MSRRVKPVKGPDNRWRTMIDTDGGPAVLIVDPPLLETSAEWARSKIDLAALDDLERKR